MNDGFWYLVSAALPVAMALMFLAWLLARRIGSADAGDIAWALGFAPVALLYFLLGQGDSARKVLILAMAVIWSLWLGGRLWLRAARRHPAEDGRYAALRERFPRHAWPVLFGLFQLQAILLVVLSVPFALACSNPATGLSAWEWAGAALWLAAMAGGLLARRGAAFCGWLVWVAYFLFALGSPDGWVAVAAPVLVLGFLLDGTGIPGAASAVKSMEKTKIPS